MHTQNIPTQQPLYVARYLHYRLPDDHGDFDDAKVMDSDQLVADQAIAYYHQTLKCHARARRYAAARGISDEAISALRLGFADRTLGLHLPDSDRAAGMEIRGSLRRSGFLRHTGHEVLRGSLVFPVFDAHGHVIDAYGRKVTPKLRVGTAYHVTLHDPLLHIFNAEALCDYRDIILCKSPLEAATFRSFGFRNVISTLGLRAFNEWHLRIFENSLTERILVAFDNNRSGNRAARLIAQIVDAIGIECRRIQLPTGMDVNACVLHSASPRRVLADAVRSARSFRQSYEGLLEDIQ